MSRWIKITLDARDLAHPLPLERAIQILQTLHNTNYLYMLHRKNPLPLLDLASTQQLQTLSQEDSEGIWHILICKNRDIHLNELLYV